MLTTGYPYSRFSTSPSLTAPGQRAGLRLRNVGLGPARIISGEVWINGRRRPEPLGRPVFDAVRDELGPDQRRPSASAFTPGAVLPTDYDTFLLSVDPYNPDTDREFVDLIGRLRIVIVYSSLYGEQTTFDWTRGGD